MADNVTFQTATLASPPDATKVSTDEDAVNGQVQRVKLAVSADGSSTHIGGDANGLQVQGGAAEDAAVAGSPVLLGGRYDATARSIDDGDVGGLAVDSSGTLQISTHSTVIDLTLSLDTGGAYSDGDVLAAAQELALSVRAGAGTGVLQSIVVVDQDDQGQGFDIVISDSTITLGTENSAVNISDADAAKIMGIVEVTAGDYIDLVNSQHVTKDNLGIAIMPDTTSAYISAISRGTGTYTASGIVLRIGILQD